MLEYKLCYTLRGHPLDAKYSSFEIGAGLLAIRDANSNWSDTLEVLKRYALVSVPREQDKIRRNLKKKFEISIHVYPLNFNFLLNLICAGWGSQS